MERGRRINKQEIKKRLNSDEDRCKYCNYSTISAGDIYCNQGFSQGMNCEGEDFAVDFNIGVITSSHQLTNGWIPVSERLPENEERVLICADRKCYDGKIIQIRTIAMYEDGTMHTDNSGFSWEDHDFEYDEETDVYIIPEGWWEQSMYCEEFGAVDDFVTHWMPLSEKPKEGR